VRVVQVHVVMHIDWLVVWVYQGLCQARHAILV
jgi:hypothetical protein